MEELNAFIDYNVSFLKVCLNKGLLTDNHRKLLIEYRDKLIDMALVLDQEGVSKNILTEFITLRFEEELGVHE